MVSVDVKHHVYLLKLLLLFFHDQSEDGRLETVTVNISHSYNHLYHRHGQFGH